MTKIPAILSAALTVSLVACADDHTPVGQPMTTPLVATESSSTAGSVTVFNSSDGLFITATAAPGWELTGSRLAVALKPSCIPQTKSGNAVLGHFLIKRTCKKAVPEIQYALPLLVDPGTQLVIALYADVHQVTADSDGHECGDHSVASWAQGASFGGSDGAMYLTYTVQSASKPTLAGQYRTYSQDAWGDSSGGAAGTYLSANFQTAFHGSVTIGSPLRFSARFSSDAAVAAFLPQAGTPAPLMRNSVNPADLANPFAGALLALSLNVGFDDADTAFSAATLALGDLVVADPSSRFYGVAVREVLSTCNEILGGRGDELMIPTDEAHDVVTRINANFENGGDLGYLGLP